MRVVAIIQARMRSTRLPGKIMKDLCGRTVLEHDLIRVRAAQLVDEIVVATTDQDVDDQVVAEARRLGVKFSRGSEQDVLSRYHLAATEHQADIIVRMTSDCPLFDPSLLDRMLTEFLAARESDHPYDYYSNTLGKRTYPTGLDAEIFTMAALERAFSEGRLPAEREHVTPYLYGNPELFHLGGMSAEVDHSPYRWTLDTPEDFELISRIYENLYREGEIFTTEEVLHLMAEQPELPMINADIKAKGFEAAVGGGLLIRTDASPEIGAGHIMRCLALAQAWPSVAGPVVFAMAEGADQYGSRLQDEGFRVEVIAAAVGGAGDVEATRALAGKMRANWLVIDGYRFDHTYLENFTEQAHGTLLMDDCGQEDLPPVDLVLNQNLHGDLKLYGGRAAGTEFLLGLKHLLLRREFLDQGPSRKPAPAEVRNILVTLGGGDPRNFTGRLLETLSKMNRPGLKIRALVGNEEGRIGELEKIAAASPHVVEILPQVADMPSQYRWADLAVTGGGSTLWEMAFLGVPAVTFIMADNQEPSSRLLSEGGTICCLGRPGDLDTEALAAALAAVMDDPERRNRMIQSGGEVIDGQGARRVVRQLLAGRSMEVTT